MVGYDTVCLALTLLHKLMSILLLIFVLPLLGLLSGVGPFYINKSQFCYPCFLLTSKGDFGVRAPPQTCQQSIFGILMAPHINTWGQTFWPS